MTEDKFIPMYDIVTICLQNLYTSNDVYVVQFYWPAKMIEISKSLALRIFNDLKHMKKMFVEVKIQGTEIGSQKEVIPNISTSRCLQAVEETEEVQAVEINGVHVERGVDSNFPSPMPTHPSSKVVAAPFNTPEGPHNPIVSNGDPETGKANKEKLPITEQRSLTSEVWEHFDRLLVGGEQVAKCKHCSNVLTGESTSGSTHLKNHLNYRCSVMKKQNQERSRLNFVKMIIKHRYPLDMADQEFFKNFVKDMQPMFEFESKDISSYMRSIYMEEKEKLQLYFDKLASKFNLTVSLWKNNSGQTAYCCLIAHFIDDSWELKMKILGLRTLEHNNDTKAVGGIIQSLVSEWNIGSKVCSITVDNSMSDDSMVDQIKEICLSDQGSVSSDHWFISFTLLEDGFREMDGILFKLRKSIEYVTDTRHGKLKFQEAVDQVKLQVGKSWDDLSFRLESDLDILDSALRSREIFCKLEQIDGNFKLNPSMEEWENAVAIQSCLKCFDDIKGTQCLPVSLYFPKLCDTYKKLLQLEKSSHSFVTLMKRKFDRYWSLCNLALAVASVLDPRLKLKIVELSYRVIYGHDSKMRLNMFHKVLRDVYYEYASEAKNLTTSSSVLDDFNCSTVGLGNYSILDSLSKFASASNFNEEASWKLELELYLDEPLLPMDGAFFDILGWWCDKSQRFPILAKMAQDFLAIPVSISTSCSNISAMINNPAYSSLNPESMEALVCNENWLETPKGNDGENNEPTQTTDKGKRKLNEDSCFRKKSKPSNCEKAISIEDIVKDSNNNGN
ncbi:zinc finger BED domain-containing protein RICESLEEPER 2-like [Gossypium arboreum]|uniref:zinc finger BED domain-containing protein RICESLEEPER 2-like n=1 Tax=Gossypium arboreum TaxID=29729 RepID=UPI0022F1D5EE|nr:zinc finger BED domain-containing protein RICESLEEPER 2-like [Gossypium arboreum]